MADMKSGTVLHRQFQCLDRAADAGLSAAYVLVLSHRDILAEFLLGIGKIRLYDGFVFTVNENA